MNKKSSVCNIVQMLGFVLSSLFLAYSFVGTFYKLPNFGEINSPAGMSVSFMVFTFMILWHFWDMNKEINALRSKFPNVMFGEPRHIEITPQHVGLYGEKSLIGSLVLQKEIRLFCINFFNKPAIPNGSEAVGAQVSVEFYDKDDERQAFYLGRWIDMPEQGFGIKHELKNISCNRVNGDVLGIAFIDKKGDDFFLLDSSIVDNHSDGTIWHIPHLLAGKYTVMVRISGENFSDISKVYEIQNLRDERLIFSEKADSKKWLAKIKHHKRKLAKLWSSAR